MKMTPWALQGLKTEASSSADMLHWARGIEQDALHARDCTTSALIIVLN